MSEYFLAPATVCRRVGLFVLCFLLCYNKRNNNINSMGKIKIISIVLGVIFLAGCTTSGSKIVPPKTGSIWKSADGGKTWEAKSMANETTKLPQMDVLSFVFNPNDANNLFVGTKDGILLQTTDGGNSWKKANFQSPKIYGLGIDASDGRIIYASGVFNKRGKVFKSLDAGENWKEVFTFPAEGPLVTNLIVDRKNSNTIYISTSDNQLLKSFDAGVSWQNIFKLENPLTRILIDSKNSDWVFVIDLDGKVFRSLDAGKTFAEISKNIKNDDGISVIEMDPFNSGWIYAGGKSGLYLSKDAGDTWQEFSSAPNNSSSYPIKAIAVNPSNSNEIIYGASLAVYKSTDGGINWTTSQFDEKQSVRVIEYNPLNPQEIFVGFSE